MTDWRARATVPAILLIGMIQALLAPGGAQAQANSGAPETDSAAADSVVRGPIEIDPTLEGTVRPAQYASVLGTRAAWLGREDGSGDFWVHPFLVGSDLSLHLVDGEELTELPVTRIRVRPEGTTLFRQAGGVTVRQHMVVPVDEPAVLVLLEVDAPRDVVVRARLRPVLQLSWPGSFGGQYAFWNANRNAYVLSESLQRRNAVVGAPGASPVAGAGTDIAIDIPVARASSVPVPLIFTAAEADRSVVLDRYTDLLSGAQTALTARQRWAADLEEGSVRLDTPNDDLDRAFVWAKVDLLGHRTCSPALGCGMVDGWSDGFVLNEPTTSGDFSGRAAGWGVIALVRAGLTDEARDLLRFQARHQRDDGKFPGRIQQSAVEAGRYEDGGGYDDGLATALWLVALHEYWSATGDSALLTELWPSVTTAMDWSIARETDDNGLTELDGAGAVAEGPLADMVKEDAYLAAVWVSAARGVATMASQVGEHALANLAADLDRLGRQSLNSLFWRSQVGHHAFALEDGGRRNDALTVWPVVGGALGHFDQLRMGATLTALSTQQLAVDWGMRSLVETDPLFDPEREGYGAVDPTATGLAAWANYRFRRPWAALPNLLALSRETVGSSRGSMASAYSGSSSEPLDGSLPQSAAGPAALINATLRGLLGWESDASQASAILAPQLPPSWDSVRVENLQVGQTRLDVELVQRRGRASATLTSSGDRLALSLLQAVPLGASGIQVRIDGRLTRGFLSQGEHDQEVRVELGMRGGPHTVEITWRGGASVDVPRIDASRTQGQGLRIVNVLRRGANLSIQVDGESGETYTFDVYGDRLRPAVNADGVGLSSVEVTSYDEETGRSQIRVTLPRGDGRAVVDLDFIS